ncbi:MAG: hypothetical protein AAFY41_07285 [Bacteroidota bacterium]
MIRLQTDEVIVNIKNQDLSWQDWHLIVTRISQQALDAQRAIRLILLIESDAQITTLVPETVDYFLNPDIFREITISSAGTEQDNLIHAMVQLLNSRSHVIWRYIPFDQMVDV